MTLSDDKSGLLQNLLGNLPETAASKLAQAVEMDRLMDGHALPHDVILSGLRSALHHASRTQTPLRLFCQPFEDLLVSEVRKDKQKAVIARASVVPIWTWLGDTLRPDETQTYFRTTKLLILSGKLDDAFVEAGKFWTLAGTAMREALADGVGLATSKKRFQR